MGSFKSFLCTMSAFCVLCFPSYIIAASPAQSSSALPRDCLILVKDGSIIKIPLLLEHLLNGTGDSMDIRPGNCEGQYQIPLSKNFTEILKNKIPLASSTLKTPSTLILQASSFGINFEIEINVLQNKTDSPRIYSIVSLKDSPSANLNLNFNTGYISPDNGGEPLYTKNFCPLITFEEIEERLWIVFPVNSTRDVCKEYK